MSSCGNVDAGIATAPRLYAAWADHRIERETAGRTAMQIMPPTEQQQSSRAPELVAPGSSGAA